MTVSTTTIQGHDVVYGIDVSRWQGYIDWAQVNPTVACAFIKATGGDGGLYVDGHFRLNAAQCGVPWGAYHFASRMAYPAVDEARWFCKEIKDTGWTLPPTLDWEPSPSVDPHVAYQWVLAFCAEVERQLGVKPTIYTGAYVSLFRGPELLNYDLWLAAYTGQPINCAPWGDNWSIWQFTSSDRQPGITANTVDGNWVRSDWLARVLDNKSLITDPFNPAIPLTIKELQDMGVIFSVDGGPQVWLDDTGGVHVVRDDGERQLRLLTLSNVKHPLAGGDEWLELSSSNPQHAAACEAYNEHYASQIG